MHVNFYATLRPLAGGKTIEVSLPTPAPVLRVLQAATQDKPDLAAEMWQAPGALKSHIKVFVNGRQSVHLPAGLETPVQAEDTLDVFPPVGGG
ncbi:MAG: MoaD/ThiS family protein [Chloroflexi bacterium]|nr:MoaD/ThiS family protein [Chloroflexota bacterium]